MRRAGYAEMYITLTDEEQGNTAVFIYRTLQLWS